MTDIDKNKTLVCEFIDALFCDGELAAVDQYLTEDFVNHNPPLGMTGDREGMRTAGAMFRGAFPDWRSDRHRLVAEGDLVTEHFTASGTQQGEVMGVAATGRRVSLHGMHIFRVRDGRIVERWGQLDELGLLTQLGVVGLP